jgi:integral membrane protein
MLLVAFMLALAEVWKTQNWTLKKVFFAFLATLVPFGTFLLDRQIRAEEASPRKQ